MQSRLLAASAAMMTCVPAFSAETVRYSYDGLAKSEDAGSSRFCEAINGARNLEG